MKKKSLILSIITFMFCLISFTFVSYAWLINNEYLNGFKNTTTGIKYVYNLKSGVNSEEMKAENITFFDIDSVNETKYFLSMAKKIEIEIKNTGDMDISYTISQDNVDIDSTDIFVLVLFSDTSLESVDTTKSIKELYSTYSSVSGTIGKYNLLDDSDVFTVYAYVIGVQPDDDATNSFLTDSDNYSFIIKTEGTSAVND